jgi:hypothetical protein
MTDVSSGGNSGFPNTRCTFNAGGVTPYSAPAQVVSSTHSARRIIFGQSWDREGVLLFSAKGPAGREGLDGEDGDTLP